MRRTKFRLAKAEARMHILQGYLKALDALDEVIALIRRSPTAQEANEGLQKLLDIDSDQAEAILQMQLRRLAAMERQKIIDEATELEARSSTTRRSSPTKAASAASSARSSLRSSTASATSVARTSCTASTATCRWKT